MSPPVFLAAALCLSYPSLVAALATCRYPDGVTSEPGHVPCNQTINAGSACCDPLDSCLASGFCLGRSGWAYRGSCTDSTWASGNFARQIDQCLIDPSIDRRYSGFTAVWSCSDPGTQENSFCCAQGDSSKSCCNSSFTFLTGIAFKPGFDQLVLNLTNGATNTTNVTGTGTGSGVSPSSSCSSSNSNLGTRVGVGVGVPLGILVTGLLRFLFYREFNKRHSKAGTGTALAPMEHINHNNQNVHASLMMQNGAMSPTGTYSTHNDQQSYSSVPALQNPPYSTQIPKTTPYNPATPVYEAPSGSNVHEMRG